MEEERVAFRRRKQPHIVTESLLMVVFSACGVRRKVSLLDIAFHSFRWNCKWCFRHNKTVSTWTHRHTCVFFCSQFMRLYCCLVFTCDVMMVFKINASIFLNLTFSSLCEVIIGQCFQTCRFLILHTVVTILMLFGAFVLKNSGISFAFLLRK